MLNIDLLTMENIFDPHHTMFLKIYVPLLAVLGFFGNFMVCIIFCSNAVHQSSMNTWIVNLAIADLVRCVNLLFMITAINGITWFKTNALCQLNGILSTFLTGTSLLSLTLISINRYFVIVKKSAQKSFTKQNTLIFILFVWLYPLALSIGPVIGWSEYVYSPSTLICLIKVEFNVSYTVVAFGTLMIIPFVILCFCAWEILIAVYRTRQRVTGQNSSRSEQRKREI